MKESLSKQSGTGDTATNKEANTAEQQIAFSALKSLKAKAVNTIGYIVALQT